MHKIFRIVLTGGPCSGKTTVLMYLIQRLQELGYIVLVVPESATLCITGGLSPVNKVVGVKIGQTAIAGLQYHMEHTWFEAAEELAQQAPVVILYDRGMVDGKAYMPTRLYNQILAHKGLVHEYVRDQRYHGVIHMVTAALGAEKFYTLANNKARYENSLAKARIQDEKVKSVWIGHGHLRIIDNSTDFRNKVRRVFKEVCHILGMPPIEHERKFLVSFRQKDLPANAQQIDIEQFYPLSEDPNVTERFRKRGQRGFFTYYRTTKQPCGRGKNIEVEDFATESQYVLALKSRRPDTGIVEKVRICFVYKSQYFELDRFVDARALPSGADGLLEIELTGKSDKVQIPDFINVLSEVTGDSRFSNFSIAKALGGK